MDRYSMEVTTSKVFDVVVIGAGAAGLQAASYLLEQQPSLSVLVLERCSVSGGRIRDVKFAEGIEMAGIGAWRVDTESKLVLDLLQRHKAATEPWVPEVKRFEARGVCVDSATELRSRVYQSIAAKSELANLKSHMVPEFLQRTLARSLGETSSYNIPTRLGDLIRKSLGEEGEQFLSAVSHGYKALAEYHIDIMGTLESANAGSETSRPVGGMSEIIKILEVDCLERGALLQHCALVKSLLRSNDCADRPPLYEVSYVTSRGRALPGSDTVAARDYDDDAILSAVKARAVILAIPPTAISRIADQQDLPSDLNVLRRITESPIFKSCFGVPAFRAAALYQRPWWDDYTHGLQPLGDRGALLTSTSRLSMIMPYVGRGPNGEAALHLSYCNDIDARFGDGFWSECTRKAIDYDAQRLVSDSDTDSDRSRAVDEVMYQYIREELAKAFLIRPEEIPDPVRFEWHYWDDGAVHVQRPVNGVPSISRKEVEGWAVNGPLVAHETYPNGSGISGDRIVLAGEGFAEKWAWVEGALVSAVKAAQTVLSWRND